MDKFQICSQASVKVGCEPIASFDDDTTESVVAAEVYDGLVEKELCEFPWRFASLIRQLSRQVDDPPLPWTGVYSRPTNLLNIEDITIRGESVDYETMGDRLLIMAGADDEVMLDGVQFVTENFWPPYFTEIIRCAMSEIFASGVAEDAQLAGLWRNKAEQQRMIARNRDSQNRTPLKVGGLGRYRAYVLGGKR